MKLNISEEFEAITQKLMQDNFYQGSGLGNELAFYIYDYFPEYELELRDNVSTLVENIKGRTQRNIIHIDMLDFVIANLKEKNLLDAAYNIQASKDNEALLEALKGVVNEAEITSQIQKLFVGKCDAILISGIGKIYPISRAHNLLNNLHAKMNKIPLVMFYPGLYNKQSLNLFNEFKDDNYYRAFRLIDREI